jgi:pullulanase/glycogen debranching enzyme
LGITAGAKTEECAADLRTMGRSWHTIWEGLRRRQDGQNGMIDLGIPSRKVLSGEVGQGLALKDAIEGSPSIFGEPSTDYWPSLNFITSHDGFTLWDLFSYSEKHNQANGENNRDGHSANFSNNFRSRGAN